MELRLFSKPLFAATFWLLISVSPVVAQQRAPDTLMLLDQYSTSSVVASKCAKPDVDKLARFVMNYQVVSGQAMTEISRATPGITDDGVTRALMSRIQQDFKSALALVETETCDGPQVKEALHRFDIQASMKLSTGESKNDK